MGLSERRILNQISKQLKATLTPVEVTGENSDALRAITKAFGKHIVFYSDRTAGRSATGDSADSKRGKAVAAGFVRPD